MQSELSISAEWERLDDGEPEERACFAALGICCNGHWLTEGRDGFVNRVRTEPLLSSYHMAEWLAWNWWRLRWEPRSNALDWSFAHRMATIGQGYVWPNIIIFSDGERTALLAKPTPDRETTAFRYISDHAAVVPSRVFEREVDLFINQVLGQLQAENITSTNLHRIWSDLADDRQNTDMTRWRRLEALLGRDPGEGDEGTIQQLLTDANTLGDRAVQELAADYARGGRLWNAEDLRNMAEQNGFSASSGDSASLIGAVRLSSPRDVPAWHLGAEAAIALRSQEGLGAGPIGNDILAKLAGTDKRALAEDKVGPDISFALYQSVNQGRVVLRSRWQNGRRFELARLLGDGIALPSAGRLHAATRAYTYRQKMQRSFAAEFLSPFEAVDEQLAGDYSLEAQQDVSEMFGVSELTIRTLLVNHQRLERDELDDDRAAA